VQRARVLLPHALSQSLPSNAVDMMDNADALTTCPQQQQQQQTEPLAA
jgi:hypothetical protein